jgi:leukotriene-A4 hydrolase
MGMNDKGDTLKIRVEYATTPQSDAIQWLEPAQTEGKVHPYLFTQCQAIHCRSFIPIQDTPGNKIVYTAEITVPSPLVALMSAVEQQPPIVSIALTTLFICLSPP